MKTSFLLAALLLAAPLTAQTDNAQELKAAELLRLSAEKAAAGHETAAAELAEKAMHMLRAEADKHRAQAQAQAAQAQARAVAEQAQALAQLGYIGETQEPKVRAEARGIMIVEGPNGREVIEFTPDMEGHAGPDGPMGLFEIKVEEDCGDCEESCETVCETECEEIVECEEDGGIWFTEDGENAFMFESDGNFFFTQDPHQAPHQDDLHHQLASIQMELEALRHELAMLRAEMGGMSGRRSMRGQMGNSRFPGQMPMRTPRMQFRVAPQMEMRDLQLHGLEGHDLQGLNLEDIRLHLQDLDIPELHGVTWPERMEGHAWTFEGGEGHEGGSHDLHIERHHSSENGATVESRLKVIINGEVYEGEAARKKLDELGHVPGIPEVGQLPGVPKVQMRVRSAPPVPPTPPATPRGEWRRSHGDDHEDL